VIADARIDARIMPGVHWLQACTGQQQSSTPRSPALGHEFAAHAIG